MNHANDRSHDTTRRVKSPKEALLDAAETLYATEGFDGVSLRQLTQAAGVNLAAVNYHFGSKENLFAEVLARRVRPINARRLELLERVLAKAVSQPPRLEDLLDAFARPFFEVSADPAQNESLRRTIARVFLEADSVAVPLLEKELLPMAQRFGRAISQARPDLPLRCIALGLLFFVGAMVNVLGSRNRLRSLATAIGGLPDDDESLQALVRYGAAGFDALAASPVRPAAESAPPGP